MLVEARDAFVDVLSRSYGNPSGVHREAREARTLLEDARDRLAGVLGVSAHEVVFTGGGTEAVNLALSGVRPAHLLWSAVEHDAVRSSAAAFEHKGLRVTELDVHRTGELDVEGLRAQLATLADDARHCVTPSGGSGVGRNDSGRGNGRAGGDATVVAVMAVNNEVGTIQPIDAVAHACAEAAPTMAGGAPVLVVDAVQALTWIDLRPVAAVADLLAVSAHKFGGPKGVGALVVRNGRKIVPLLHGGGQEQERRSGTQNVAGAVAMAVAAEITDQRRTEVAARIAALRDTFVDSLVATIEGCIETAPRSTRVAGNAHVCIAGVASEEVLVLLDRLGVAASAGSACASGALHLSPVLEAMGVEREFARGALRCTLGPSTTEADIAGAAALLRTAIAQLRGGTQ